MSASLLLLALVAQPTAALEITIPDPSKTLPMLPRFLEAAARFDERVSPKIANRMTGGLVAPFDPKAIAAIGVDVTKPFHLVRPEPRGRHLMFATIRDPARWDRTLKEAQTKVDIAVRGEHAVIGARGRWQTLLRRDKTNLFVLRATNALGLINVDVDKLVKREAPNLSTLARHRPLRWRRPRGLPNNADVYVRLANVQDLTSLNGAFTLSADRADAVLNIVFDAVPQTMMAEFIDTKKAKTLLDPASSPPTVEVWANVPTPGQNRILAELGIPVLATKKTKARGPIQIALSRDGDLAIAVEMIDGASAEQLAKLLTARYPKATIVQTGGVVLTQFGSAKRSISKRSAALPSSLTVHVGVPDVFRALNRRSDARDGAEVDTAQLAIARFAYGPLLRLGRRIEVDFNRNRYGFVVRGSLFYERPENPTVPKN